MMQPSGSAENLGSDGKTPSGSLGRENSHGTTKKNTSSGRVHFQIKKYIYTQRIIFTLIKILCKVFAKNMRAQNVQNREFTHFKKKGPAGVFIPHRHTHIYLFAHSHMHTYAHRQIHKKMYTYTCTHAHTNTNAHNHTHIYIYT